MPAYTSGTPTEGGVVILKPGIYLALVTEAKDDKSKNNNPMIDLTLALYKFDKTNKKAIKTGAKAWDSLVFTEKAFWKIDQFRAATGETFEAGVEVEITSQWCMSRRGWVRVGNETIEQGKHAGKEKNVIEQWLFDYNPLEDEANQPSTPTTPDKNETAPDDIPF